jgi:hypothetical protein
LWGRDEGEGLLVKGGTRDYANAGLEPISEVCASAVAAILGIDHVSYLYKNIHGHVASVCKLFTTEDVGLMTADEYIQWSGWIRSRISINETIDLLKKISKETVSQFKRMIFLDDLIRNPDRHLNNWGLFVDNNTRELLGFSTLWDSGEGLVAKTVPMRDFPEMATSEEQFSSFGIYYKGLRSLYYAEQEKRDCNKIITMVTNNSLINEFKKYGVPDSEENKLKIICDILKARAEMIISDMTNQTPRMTSFN